MRRYFTSLLFTVAFSAAYSQVLRQPISAIYTSLGAYSTKNADVFSYTNNQASLAQVKKTSFGAFAERRFMLTETSVYAASVAIPSSKGNFGVNIRRFGFKNFNENQLGLAYARSLGPKVDIGVQFNYYGYNIPAYNSSSTVNTEFGMMVHLTEKINAGFHVYNPIGGKFSKTDEKLTSAYKFGVGYDASEEFYVSAELVKEQDYPANVNMGFQYRFNKILFVRGGIATASSIGFAGAGIGWSNFRLDISGSYHPQLGFSPGLLFIASLSKKEKTVTTGSNE